MFFSRVNSVEKKQTRRRLFRKKISSVSDDFILQRSNLTLRLKLSKEANKLVNLLPIRLLSCAHMCRLAGSESLVSDDYVNTSFPFHLTLEP